MIKNYLLLAALVFTCSAKAQSPITLSNSNMPGSGDTLRYTNVQLSSLGNYTQTGVNFNWDFSNVVSTTSDIRSFKSALQTPYAFYFLSLNEYGEKIADTLASGVGSVSITKYYNFYKKSTSPNAFIADGSGLSLSNVPLAAYYSDKDELYNFPMTYPKYDSTTFRFSTPSTSLIPIIYSRTGTRATKVDGWGTIATPNSTASCLRLVTTQYSRDTMAISLSTLIPVPIKIGFVNNQRSYQWFTTGSKIPFFEVTGSLIGNNFTITQVRYRGFNSKPASTVGIKAEEDISAMELYPNPVKDRLWLSNTGTQLSGAELLDINGKILRKTDIGQMDKLAFIDVADLPTGLYILKAAYGQKQVFLKFIKE